MILRPWHQIKLLQERLAHAEAAVTRLMRNNEILSTNARVQQRELSNAHAALRRKNLTLKRLRTKSQTKKTHYRTSDVLNKEDVCTTTM
jgi:hypothetical protein